MGAAGSPHANFQRAVERGNVLLAFTVAKELGTLSLEDALALTAMLARVGDERFEPAAVRWLGRLAAEKQVSVEDLAIATSALCALKAKRGSAEVERMLLHLSRRPRRAVT